MDKDIQTILGLIKDGISEETLHNRLQFIFEKYNQDTKLVNWLDEMGVIDCPGLINDDCGHWAVSFTGTQTVPMEPEPQDIYTSFLVKKDEWKSSVREAIVSAMEKYWEEEDNENL